MADHFLLGNLGSTGRIRTVVPGQDVMNDALDERYVTFDSTWNGGLRLLANGVRSAASLTNFTVTYPQVAGDNQTRRTKILPSAGENATRPTIAMARRGAGSFFYHPNGGSDQATSYQRGYCMCGVSLQTNNILLSPQLSGVDYIYYIFGNNGTSAETTGANEWLLGNHPTYGPGLFISRPGFDVDTASLDDMMLTTRKPIMQIYETGTANYTGYITTNPFESPDLGVNGAVNCSVVDLATSYPDYPPIIVYPMGNMSNLAAQHCGAYWLNSSRILVFGGSTTVPLRYAIVALDPAFAGGTDASTGINRWIFENGVLKISKPNISVTSAGQTDFLFRSDRFTPRLKGYSTIAAAAGSNFYNLPSPPPVGAGAPFNFFLSYDAQANYWWCGCGSMAHYDVLVFISLVGQYGAVDRPRAWVANRTQYYWDRPAEFGSVPGFTATLNVSDFS